MTRTLPLLTLLALAACTDGDKDVEDSTVDGDLRRVACCIASAEQRKCHGQPCQNQHKQACKKRNL